MATKKTFDIGDEIEAMCNKCKSPTVHVVEALKNGKVTKVMCKSCTSSHRYRKPGKEKTTKAKSKTTSTGKKKKTKEQRRWSRMMGKADTENVKEYKMDASFEVYDVLDHEQFGEGVVTEVIDPSKILVTFEDGSRTLVQNR